MDCTHTVIYWYYWLRVNEVVVDTMGVGVMRVDQMGVNPYDGLYVCGRTHVDMGHACMSVISCDIHCTRM